MQFSTKKMGVNFFFEKMPNWGGGPGGSLAKDQTFSGFSFVHTSLIFLLLILGMLSKQEKSKSCIITSNDGIFLQSRINVRSAVMFIVGMNKPAPKNINGN